MRRSAVGVMAAVSVGAFVALGPPLGAQGAQGRGRGEGQTVILEQAPTDRLVPVGILGPRVAISLRSQD